MTLSAKLIVKNKCWILEDDDGRKIGTIHNNGSSITLVRGNKREEFNSLKKLSDRYNILVDKINPAKQISESHKVYEYPCDHNAQNILWDIKHRLPIFTKGRKSKSFFCAGYYIVKFNNGWVKSYCPKLITLNRYPYQGPFKSQEEMIEKLRIANGNTTKSTP